MTDGLDAHRSALAERLRGARKAAGLSQGQEAKLLQMHRPTVSEIEAGNRRASTEELPKFAEIRRGAAERLLPTIGVVARP